MFHSFPFLSLPSNSTYAKFARFFLLRNSFFQSYPLTFLCFRKACKRLLFEQFAFEHRAKGRVTNVLIRLDKISL